MGRSNTYRLANHVITAVTMGTSVAIRTTWEMRMGFTSGEGDSEHRQHVAPGRDSCDERNERRMKREQSGARITNSTVGRVLTRHCHGRRVDRGKPLSFEPLLRPLVVDEPIDAHVGIVRGDGIDVGACHADALDRRRGLVPGAPDFGVEWVRLPCVDRPSAGWGKRVSVRVYLG